MKFSEQKFKSDDCEISYRSAGEGNRQKILFVHGNPGRWSDINPEVMASLAEDFHMVSFDRPGFGNSRARENSFGSQLKTIEAIINNLGWESYILAGYSYGAAVCLDFASKQTKQIEALLLIDPWVYPRTEDNEAKSSSQLLKVPGMYRAMKNKIEAQIKAHYERCLGSYSPPEEFWTERKPTKESVLAMLANKKNLLEIFPELINRYKNISTKTFILALKNDPICAFDQQAERLFNELPNASLVSEPDAAHAFSYLQSKALIRTAKLLKEEEKYVVNQA